MRQHRGPIALIFVAVVGVAASISPAAGASASDHHGSSGIIAFQRVDESGRWQIWTANADLTHQRQLTSGESNSGWATWKPDGTRVAFDSDRSDPDPTDDVGANDVYTMRTDGTGVVQVTDSPAGSAATPAGHLTASGSPTSQTWVTTRPSKGSTSPAQTAAGCTV